MKDSTPLIYHYLKKYQDDPSSRVFAPLAEAYRKAGLVEQAVEIAREGLRIHPHFIGGRVALARALFDQKKFEEVIEELTAVIQDVPDNLVAQKLLGESHLILGHVAEALGCFKMLLFFSPQDTETAQLVRELESQAYDEGALVIRSDRPRSPPRVAVEQVQVVGARDAFLGDSQIRHATWMQKVEKLQNLLQKVERYRLAP